MCLLQPVPFTSNDDALRCFLGRGQPREAVAGVVVVGGLPGFVPEPAAAEAPRLFSSPPSPLLRRLVAVAVAGV